MYTNIIKTKIIGFDDVYKFHARHIFCNFVIVVSLLVLVLPLLPLPEHMYLKGGVKAQCGRLSVRPYKFNVE
jgi:hypothetical protein